MTAQASVLNKRAIVLATDSAVTIENNRDGKKIYNSVNKLFAFSKKKPIAVMVYGNAELMGVPWETIIKVYRKQMKSDYKTLDGYANNFLRWLEGNSKKLFSHKMQEHYFKQAVYSYYESEIFHPVQKEIERVFNERGEMREEEALKLVSEKVKATYDFLKNKNYINNFTDEDLNKLFSKHKKTVESIIEEFSNKKLLNQTDRNKLVKIACFLFLKDIFSSNYSGVVIAGFGDDDLFPSLIEFKIESVFENKINYKKENQVKITSDEVTASINLFAQGDTMHTFLSGIHPDNVRYFARVLQDYPSIIAQNLRNISSTERKSIKKKIQAKNEEIFNKFMEATSKQFAEPVVGMVNLMPITEMCEFAESLVNLTSLRKKVTMEDETVGGETEVLSITKGEGLIWIKRKHYFDSRLNTGFIKDYLNM